MTLSPEEIVRYQRHLSLTGFGAGAQLKLKHARVLVVGAGGLGCPALLYLAAAGAGHITILDDDCVDVSNLQRQILFSEAELGRPKAQAAAQRLQALNPLITVEPRVERLRRDNALPLVAACDVVVDGSDNFATRYLVNDACVIAGRPFVYGAIQGFEGQVSVFNWRGGPTYRCLFPEPPAPGTVPNCAEAGVLGVLPGLIGTAQACEAIKLLTGAGEPLCGRLLMWDALTMTTRVVRFAADPQRLVIRELPPEGYGATCGVAAPPGADEISVDELRRMRILATSEAHGPDACATATIQLIDVREEWERALGAIEPSVHVPLAVLERSGIPVTIDPAKPTVVYCAAGARSRRALVTLRGRDGFTDARSLCGGFKAWSVDR